MEWNIHRHLPAFISALLLVLLACAATIPAGADTIPLDGGTGHAGDWNPDDSPTVGTDLFPTVVIEPGPGSSSKKTPAPATPAPVWVTISPFTASLDGQETRLIVGYLGGDRVGARVTIAGKEVSADDFSDIATLSPDENGLFVWAIPAARSDSDLFRVAVVTGDAQVISNAVRFSGTTTDPVIRPVSAPATPVPPVSTPIPIPMVSDRPTAPSLTRLTLSASTTSPVVGEQVTISGRLTDGEGKGISGADIAIDESGYPGAVQDEPFVSVRTGSDGRFEHSLTVSFADSVGLVARFEGDDTHNPAESNTLFFSAREA